MAQQGRLRPYTMRPYDDGIGQGTMDFLDWVQQTLNVLVGQRLNVTGSGFAGLASGLPGVGATQISPATQIVSQGGRVSAIGSIMSAVSNGGAPTQVTFFYDGTNNSNPFIIYRDDGTIITPISGSKVVTGLTNGQKYTFYPYWDDVNSKIVWGSGVSGFVGVPNVALPINAANYAAIDLVSRQQTLLSGRIPLWTVTTLGVVGPTTATAGATGIQYTIRTGSGY